MSVLLERIRRIARQRPQRLVFSEAGDARIVAAAARVQREGFASVELIGNPDEALATMRQAEVAPNAVPLHDARDPGRIAATRAALVQARGDKLAPADADRHARDPLFQAAAMVRAGDADVSIAGATRTTADVLRAALGLIGLAPGIKTVSSFFLMVLPGRPERVFTFADCAVLPDPDAAQLAELACLAADHHQRLVQEVPHVALLSFSTRGSAKHARVDKVREATALARARRPDLHIDGELQLDAAIDAGVAARKAPDSVVAGHANVLVFPDLDAGNIGYKLVQRFAAAAAYGPIVQGLARPANDLSRGCSVEDVIETSAIACALAATA